MNRRTTIALPSGNNMPVIGLGTWQLTSNTAETVAHALEAGYTMIDTSGDYGTQPAIGQAIRGARMERDAIYLVTKVEETENSYRATRKNLSELDLDYADLVLIHRPPEEGVGEVLWEGLLQAKREGLARDIGVSNYSVGQLEELTELTGERPVVNQIEWTPFGFSREMLDYCRRHRIVIQAYSPLTRGERLADPVLVELAGAYGKTPAQLLLRWNLQCGTVPLPKANRVSHLEENLAIFDFELAGEDMDVLDGLNQQYSALGGRIAYA